MRNLVSILLFIFFSSLTSFAQETFCLQLSEVSNDGSTYVVKIEMQGSNAFELGSGNLQFTYPDAALSSPVLLSSPIGLPGYLTPTVTSAAGEASLNIELLAANTNTATVAAAPAWTELGQISFTIDDASALEAMVWLYNGGTTETIQFLGDEATQLFATTPSCLVSDAGGTSNVRLLSVNPISKLITIKNFGTADEDISLWRLCSNLKYTFTGMDGDAAIALVDGDYNLSPNEEVTVMWTPTDGFRPAGDDVGLYFPSGGFGSPSSMADFTQYKTAGNGRESVAVAKGIWSMGQFVSGEAPFNYIGAGTEIGENFWQGTVVAAACGELFISEYGEPDGGNGKYVEIYNPTGAAVDLSTYEIWKISNGGAWTEQSFALSGMLASGATAVIGNNAIDVPSGVLFSTGVINFNGDDAVGLANAGVLVDAVGIEGLDPGAGFEVAGVANGTQNNTIVRKNTVESGNTNWAESAGTDAANSEWIVVEYSQDDTGVHSSTCVSGPVDSDGDGVLDGDDNCANDANADQADLDSDGVGDVCDPDIDGDGVINEEDCAPTDALVFEGATCDDGDATTVDDVIIADCTCEGTSTSADADGDGVPDVDDNCINDENADQADLDGDGLGDVCDDDIDGDGSLNVDDCDPTDAAVFTGASCDDGDPNTSGDVIQADCSCAGFGPTAPCTELFISEYGEPDGGNGKYIEIHNPSPGVIDLSTYEVWKIANGGSWPESSFALSGTIASGATIVVGNNTIDVPSSDFVSTGVINFNGDDAVGLAKGGVLIDAVGTDGDDPGAGFEVAGVANATQNGTIVRKSVVDAPTIDWASSAGTDAASSEWIVLAYSQDNIDMHTSECISGPVDTDGDGIFDSSDNCPLDANADQADLDGDGVGDVCDTDIDGDGNLNDDDCDPLDSLVFVGASCDDGDPTTTGDILREDCTCAGFGAGSECAQAISITDGIYTSPGINAIGGPTATNLCMTGATDALWYSYTATVSDSITISSSIDPDLPSTRVSVHSACDNLDCIVFDDESGEGFTSIAKFLAVSGETYLIEWDDRWNGGEFDFEIGPSMNSCPTDLDGNGVTEGADFSIFLGNFGLPCPLTGPCATDFDNSGTTDGADFSIFLGNYGLDCPPSE